uniref:Uncharacterized protein n=1 Tax=Anguilla anguilla TaxID=7936 RepID=A0A0E9PMQ9_ANGAN
MCFRTHTLQLSNNADTPSSSDPPLALRCCRSSLGTRNFPTQLI